MIQPNRYSLSWKIYQNAIFLISIGIFWTITTCCQSKFDQKNPSIRALKVPESMKNAASLSISKSHQVNATMKYLEQEMDTFHTKTVVFDDFESAGSRFYPTGWMKGPDENWPSQNEVPLELSYPTKGAHQGASCLRITWAPPREEDWVAVAWQYPENNWGNHRGLNLEGANRLSFWAKGETGKEFVRFKFGIIHVDGKKYQDSCREISTGLVKLTDSWEKYEIDLSDQDLENVISGFGFAIGRDRNPNGCVFYLDDISINHSRLKEPRLIRSYNVGNRTLSVNKHLRNTCFVYDNALAICAFLSSPSIEHHFRARLIADAIVQLSSAEIDGSLKNAYANGDLFAPSRTNQTDLVPRFPGYINLEGDCDFDWCEDKYSKGVDCGNMAWAMLALLNVWNNDGRKMDSVYLKTVKRMGNWILSNATDTGKNAFGFRGGKVWNSEALRLEPVSWKSTEHNIDLWAVFERLAAAETDTVSRTKWKEASKSAEKFVRWAQEKGNADGGRLITGTLKGTNNPAMTPKPLDPQTWSILASPVERGLFERALNWAIDTCLVEQNGIWGFQFSAGECKDLWPEGTAQVALALRSLGRDAEADAIVNQLELIMTTSESVKETPGAMPAAFPTKVMTGFGWNYYNFPHLGATAWFLLAYNSWNPFSGQQVP